MMDDLTVEGIQLVTAHDIATWRKKGVVPQLVGSLNFVDSATRAAVGIRTYLPQDPLARVSGKSKASRITTDAMGETIAIGSGTEALATAAAALKGLEHILAVRAAKIAGSWGEEGMVLKTVQAILMSVAKIFRAPSHLLLMGRADHCREAIKGAAVDPVAVAMAGRAILAASPQCCR